MKYKYLLFLLFTLSAFSSNAQRKLPISITLDTKTWQINELDKLKIPFDESFYITGSFDESRKITSMILKYKLKNHCKKSKENPKDTINKNHEKKIDSDSIKIKKVINGKIVENCTSYYNYRNHYYLYSADEKLRIQEDGYVHLNTIKFEEGIKKFRISMDPLHANEEYELVFEFYERKVITKEVQQVLKKEIIFEINKTYGYKKNTRPSSDFGKLNKKITKIVSEKLEGSRFYDSKDNLVNFKDLINDNEELNKRHITIYKTNDSLHDLYESLSFYKNFGADENYVKTKLLIDELRKRKNKIKKTIDKLLSNNHFSKIILEPANAVVDPKITIKDVLNFISADINRWQFYMLPNNPDVLPTNVYMVEILLGRAKIYGNVIESVETHDSKSGLLLWSTLNFLQNAKYKNGKNVIPFDSLKVVNENFRKWNTNVKGFNHLLKNKLSNEEKKMGNLFNDLYSKKDLGFYISTNEVLETRESNYIGLDFGLMVAPEIGSTFVFEGFNFYFSPVNKRVGSKKLKGFDKILKTFSLSLGIAQRVGSTYNDNYESLVGVGSPFIGVGYRLNKNIRFSSGAILYEVSDFNPLISGTSVKSTYFLSLSWDISFRDLIKTAIGI